MSQAPDPPKKTTAIVPIKLLEPYWEKQPGESTLWFRRFCRMRNQVGIRSLLAVYRAEFEEGGKGGKKRRNSKNPGKLPRKVPGAWEIARVKYCWKERLDTWDLYQQEKEDQIWFGRLEQTRNREWEYAELLLAKAEPMLRVPIIEQQVTQRDPSGKVALITIQATDWSQFKVPLAIAKTGFDFAYHACGDTNWAMQLLRSKGLEVSFPGSEPEVDTAEEFVDLAADDLSKLLPGYGEIPPEDD